MNKKYIQVTIISIVGILLICHTNLSGALRAVATGCETGADIDDEDDGADH